MNKIRFLTFVLLLGTLILSACGAAATTATPAPVSASQKVEAMPVTFVGIVDSIAGDQWVISGTTVTVDESIVRDGPFTIGDRIKVEGLVNPDGSLTVSRVEAPAPQETATQPPVVVDNSNEAIGNTNTNDANVNDSNTNDDSSVNSNDSNTNDDDGANTNDDNSNDSNVNDDSNTNDDNGNDDNGNDDGGNTNDDNGGNDNGDDDGGNSNDDDSNDDNSGGGNGNDDSGDDDNGSGGGGSDD